MNPPFLLPPVWMSARAANLYESLSPMRSPRGVNKHIYIYIYIYMYTRTYKEREGERERYTCIADVLLSKGIVALCRVKFLPPADFTHHLFCSRMLCFIK